MKTCASPVYLPAGAVWYRDLIVSWAMHDNQFIIPAVPPASNTYPGPTVSRLQREGRREGEIEEEGGIEGEIEGGGRDQGRDRRGGRDRG